MGMRVSWAAGMRKGKQREASKVDMGRVGETGVGTGRLRKGREGWVYTVKAAGW